MAVDVAMRVSGPTDAAAAARAAVAAYVAGLPLGAGLVLSRVIQVAHDADGRVASVSGVLLNGVAGDLAAPSLGRLVLGSVVLS